MSKGILVCHIIEFPPIYETEFDLGRSLSTKSQDKEQLNMVLALKSYKVMIYDNVLNNLRFALERLTANSQRNQPQHHV